MRVAIVSDTHLPRGRRSIPPHAIELMAGAQAILHAGEMVAAPVLEQLRSLGPPIHAVHGNVDEVALQRELPATLELELAGVTVAMIHDAGPSRGRIERLCARFPGAGAVIFGHSHIPLHERSAEGFQIFNPGSPTERRRAPTHTMGIASILDGEVSFELVELTR
jgi:putative phosphoesterase